MSIKKTSAKTQVVDSDAESQPEIDLLQSIEKSVAKVKRVQIDQAKRIESYAIKISNAIYAYKEATNKLKLRAGRQQVGAGGNPKKIQKRESLPVTSSSSSSNKNRK